MMTLSNLYFYSVTLARDAVLEEQRSIMATFLFIFFAILAVFAMAGIILLFVKFLSKSNDFGDEDDQHMRSFLESGKQIGHDLSSDLSVGSMGSMTKFRYNEVSKK